MNTFISPAFEGDFQRKPVVLVDIGASGGLQPHWKVASKHLKVFGFEPDEREFGRLQGSAPEGTSYFNVALADKPGPLRFNLMKKQMVSSIFEPNLPLLQQFPDVEDFEIVRAVELPADMLDNVMSAARISDIDFMKIDTQGAELGILRGGEILVKNSVFGLEIEVEFMEIYKGQPLFSDVDVYVRGLGFDLFDMRPIYWKRKSGADLGKPHGQLAFGDALYFRSAKSVAAVLSGVEGDEARRSKLLRAIAVLLVYGYLDYAWELFHAQLGLFNQQEISEFESALKTERRTANQIPDFRGRWRLAEWLRKLSDTIDPSQTGWSISGRTLGNRE